LLVGGIALRRAFLWICGLARPLLPVDRDRPPSRFLRRARPGCSRARLVKGPRTIAVLGDLVSSAVPALAVGQRPTGTRSPWTATVLGCAVPAPAVGRRPTGTRSPWTATVLGCAVPALAVGQRPTGTRSPWTAIVR